MKYKVKKTISVLLTAFLLLGIVAAFPAGVSAAETNTLTINVRSNLFPDKTLTVSDTEASKDSSGDVYVTMEMKLNAPGKFIIGLELDKIEWDTDVLEYDVSYNKVGEGRNAQINLFPFSIEQGFGSRVINTGKISQGRLVGNYSGVSSYEPYAALAYGENGEPITLVKAIFKVKNPSETATTTVNCDFEVLSLDDDTTQTPSPRYIPIENKVVNQDVLDDLTIDTSLYLTPCVMGHSVKVESGEVGLNYYMNISDPNLSASIDSLTAEFTWGEEGTVFGENTFTPEIKQADSLFLVTCPVPAPSMSDTVTLSVKGADGIEIISDKYSVVSYVDAIREDAQSAPLLKRLVCDMLDYGAATQQQFAYRANDLASKNLGEWFPDYTPAEAVELTDTTDLDDLEEYGIEYEGSSIVTRAKASIRLYFTVKDSDKFSSTKVSWNGKSHVFKVNEGRSSYVFLEISDIKADKIFDDYTIKFSNNGNTVNKHYTAASNYNVVKKGNVDTMKNVMRAMYNYSESTANYIK